MRLLEISARHALTAMFAVNAVVGDGLSSKQGAPVTVKGRVLGGSRTPAGGVRIDIVAGTDSLRAIGRTGADGLFSVSISGRPRTIRVIAVLGTRRALSVVRTIGPQEREISIGDLVLDGAQQLAAVRALAERPRPTRRQGGTAVEPGEIVANVDLASSLDATAADNTDAWMTAPGAMMGVDPLTGLANASIGGLSANENRATINGMATSGGRAPRDGGLVQVYSSTYDPTKSGAGIIANWLLLGGSFADQRRLHASATSSALSWTSTAARESGQPAIETILSGNLAGTTRFLARFINMVFQLESRTARPASLLNVTGSTLAGLGLSVDSVRRVTSQLGALGIASALPGLATTQSTTRLSSFARLDFTSNNIGTTGRNADGTLFAFADAGARDVFYVIVGGSLNDSRGLGLTPSSLPTGASRTSEWTATAMGVYSTYIKNTVLSETRLSVTTSRMSAAPESDLPAARVLISGVLADGSSATGSVQAAGSGMSRREAHDINVSLASIARWSTLSSRHEFRLGLESGFSQGAASTSSGAGSFVFNSVDDFLSARPASYQRRIDSASTSLTSLIGAVGLGDTYRPSRSLAMQAGIRIEAQRSMEADAVPQLLDSLSRSTFRRLPSWVSVAPMAGFTWLYATDSLGVPDSRRQLIGGLRDYRGTMPFQTLLSNAAGNGLNGVTSIIRCVGSAVPLPSWGGYSAGSSSLPRQCLAGSPDGSLAQAGQPVTGYRSDFTPSHSWRGDLVWTTPVGGSFSATVRGTWSINSALARTSDLNFLGQTLSVLAAEANRPVFSAASSIVPATGAISVKESRRSASFEQVLVRSSQFQSVAKSLTVALSYRPKFSTASSRVAMPYTVSYSFSDARSQTDGFSATTAGDPRSVEWADVPVSRHSVSLNGGLFLPDVGTFSLGLQIRSGIPFTPLVNADINGDGMANDRAMVFRTSDTSSISTAMGSLIASAPSWARDCLTRQVGTIARAGSCVGPYFTRLDASFTLDSYRLGLQNRGTVRLLFSNVLSGLDLLLHGANKAEGWGQPPIPDGTLLNVRGFDPAANRFQYQVNPLFGRTLARATALVAPFRITLDVNLDVGQNREARALSIILMPLRGDTILTRRDLTARLASRKPPLFDRVIEKQEELGLTVVQAKQLIVVGDQYDAFRDSVYFDLAGMLLNPEATVSIASKEHLWHEAIAGVIWRQWESCQTAKGILSPLQQARVFAADAALVPAFGLLTRGELQRQLKRWMPSSY